MRLGFVTCVQLGLSCMKAIERSGGQISLIVTLKDERARSKSGRVWVDDFAREHGSTLLKVDHIDDPESVQAIRAHRIDWLFVIGWSQIAGAAVLQAPRRGVLGIHPTLLPIGRGRAPIPWAILKGLNETGVTLFQLDEDVDSGPIVAQLRLSIAPDETATSLYARVQVAHETLIEQVMPQLMADQLSSQPQDEARATYWPARRPADGAISSSMTAAEIDRLVRATTRPYPGAFFDDGTQRIRVWAGAPAPAPRPQGMFLWAADGYFEATEFEIERPD